MSDYNDVHQAAPDEQAKVFAKLKKLRVAMLTTQAQDRALESRPMTLQDIDDDGSMWFFTSARTALVDAIRSEAQVNVAFVDASDSFYLSTSAHAVFVEDREKIDALWSPMATAWFPDGPSDPDLRLLRVDAGKVDYWLSRSGKIVQMLAIAKAAARHTTPGPEAGEHGTFTPSGAHHETVTSVGSR
jgi:general stress protein 26